MEDYQITIGHGVYRGRLLLDFLPVRADVVGVEDNRFPELQDSYHHATAQRITIPARARNSFHGRNMREGRK